MNIRKLRLQRGWTQEQLAELSGLSIRTIQRIERGRPAGLETLRSLAAVFDVEFTQLQTEADMANSDMRDQDEQTAIEYVRDLKTFYANLMTYVVVISGLFILNYMTSPDYIWAWWPAIGWGLGMAIQGIHAFEIFDSFGPEWERKQVEKRLGRKL
jgi:transcriptional regulator with XRE-family HTH domain